MANNCFIYETLSDVKTLKRERTSDGLMRLSGTFGVCGVMNNNKRIYEKANYGAMVKRLQERIANEGCPGELEHPNSMNITLENVSHKIDSIDIDENGVVTGTITLLNTPKGKIAQAIVEGGLPLFISSRAQGNVSKDGHVTLEDLKTYDLVGTPGFSQARLKLNEGQIVESLGDTCFVIENTTEKNDNTEMTNEEFESKLASLNEELENLKEEIKRRPTINQVAEGVENWIKEEYTEKVDSWISETVIPTIKNDLINQISNGVENWVKEELADGIQNWVVEEFAPGVEKWISEEYSDTVQKWVTEEYSQGVEKWVKEEYSDGVQNWIVEHFAPEIQNWIVEHFAPEVDKWVSEKINDSITESIKGPDTLAEIDSIIEAINEADQKPKYSRKQILTEAKNEGNEEPRYIQLMPQDKRAQWNMASDDVKESIMRRAKLYNLVNEAKIEEFWNNINFQNIKPTDTVLESMDVMDEWEKNMRARLHRNRK